MRAAVAADDGAHSFVMPLTPDLRPRRFEETDAAAIRQRLGKTDHAAVLRVGRDGTVSAARFREGRRCDLTGVGDHLAWDRDGAPRITRRPRRTRPARRVA